MPEERKRQKNLLPYERFRFSLGVMNLMVLPPYKGGIFRGSLGNAFRHVVCVTPQQECATCLLREKCLYMSLFEPPPPPDYQYAAKFSKAPPPYVLNPPLTNRQAFHPRDTLDFELVLIGRAIDALPYFAYTFMEMGRKGLGRERGKYEIDRVDLMRDAATTQIYDGRTQTLSTYPQKEEPESHARDETVSALTLDFLTPLRLKVKGDLVTRLTFPLLFERLAQRLTLLAAFYGTNSRMPDFTSLIDRSREIEVSADTLHWYDWERYSGRQKTTMSLGGLRGKISFSGDLTPFMPFLRLGEQVNVGQSTSFGLGRYKTVIC
ncbi:MAG: CRISPR system precrRNA processing endoribonuclease RAMP protein Cas6 [Deltaproteobacteria bacterium]|nr:CRISPR system precrRNA processing endoribonuclease RAMP protein Cas6 [Deltaproteobacteria bacterium]